ncbi:tRNA pseudouridine synthase B [uncultured Gammaproteobacteria bacterium]
MAEKKSKGRPINGWLVLDKPAGLTSTQALSRARWLFGAAKAGHGGTLDPIATGVLPVAFGAATKTVSWVMDGIKTYHFTVRWGERRDTDDCAGAVIETSPVRPERVAIEAALPAFCGEIEQIPPIYSAIKIAGQRAYDLAREGGTPEMAPRRVMVKRFELIDMPDADHAEFEVVCGKGTYMRSLARDLGQALGGCGHIAALRRLAVGRFTLEQAISLDELAERAQTPALDSLLLPIETALADIPALALTVVEAQRMRQGQSVTLFTRPDLERLERLGPAVLDEGAEIVAFVGGRAVALAVVEGAVVRPLRLLNF